MTFENFVVLMKRLVEHFGEKGFPAEKLEILYRRCKNMAYEDVLELRKLIISNCKINPTMREIDDVGVKVFSRSNQRRVTEKRHRCSTCSDVGILGEFISDCDYNGNFHYRGEMLVFDCPDCGILDGHAGLWTEQKKLFFTRIMY